jgi:uncharacterized membrane protein YbaN (DUF454 family)
MENNTSSEHGYFNTRLEDQLHWYSEKAGKNKKRFYAMQIIIIVTGASISIVNGLRVSDALLGYIGVFSAILGAVVIIVTALLQLFKSQENWILYRTTAELLKKEKFYYLNSVGEYAGLSSEQKEKMLVERVETIVSSESSKYFSVHKPEK